MPRTMIFRRHVYRSAVHPQPRRSIVPIVHRTAVSGASIAARRRRPANRPPAPLPSAVLRDRNRSALAFGYPGTNVEVVAVEQAATRGVGRRMAAVRVVIARMLDRQKWPDARYARKRHAEVAFVMPGVSSPADALRFTDRRVRSSRVVRLALDVLSRWGAAQRANDRTSGQASHYSPTAFTPVYYFQWRSDERRLRAVRVVNRVGEIRRAWGDAQHANDRQQPSAYIFSPSEQALTWASPLVAENTRRRRVARMIGQMLDDRKRWPHWVTRKAQPIEIPDATVRATGFPGLMAPGRHHWHDRWSLYVPTRPRQRRGLRQPLNPATPWTFDGTLLGTLRVRPTYEIDDLYLDPAFAAGFSTNGEG